MESGTLHARGVYKAYGATRVLEDLNLNLEPGIIYGLIGRNGAGKTTLLSILSAQNTWDRGSVTYGELPVWENQAALDHLCFSREFTSVLASDLMGMRLKHYLYAASIFYPYWDEAYAQTLLEAFQLEPQQKILQLSKGQASMAAILVGLASRADMTFLDEPAAGLDVVMREKFYRLLLEDFAQTNRTFVISTHIIEEASSVFERVLFLDQGHIMEDASTEELLSQFRTVSGRADLVKRACQGLTVLQVQEIGRRQHVILRGEERALEALTELDVDVSPMSLQQVFVALCGHGDV